MDIRNIFSKKNQDEYYYCIADAHGLHTFMPYKRYEKDAEIFEQIVEDNRARHAVSFGVVLNQTEIKKIGLLVSKGYNEEALLTIKKSYDAMSGIGDPEDLNFISFPPKFKDEYLVSFKLIPDHALDPHYSNLNVKTDEQKPT